ncbi:unnamed protein product [Acanthoscelides obtectus]|uniref:Uncharacterized protein n=1 Tax=Acanthoscelides obtectus TaxID=200917 RepID=A0A9P0K5I6_ACAOB|nr:unnamed protein product [Acanthoscelides obtectus]CAK1658235.1 hypothetical protein AOBTE_LOCUS20774 [Acanthoscelides obtectus]
MFTLTGSRRVEWELERGVAILPGRTDRRSEVQQSHASLSRQPSAQRNVYAFTAPCRALFGLPTFFSGGVHYRVLDCLSVVL